MDLMHDNYISFHLSYTWTYLNLPVMSLSIKENNSVPDLKAYQGLSTSKEKRSIEQVENQIQSCLAYFIKSKVLAQSQRCY